MKKSSFLPFILIVLIGASCSMRSNGVKAGANNGKLAAGVEKNLFAVMKMKDTIKIGAPVELRFTVYNHTDTVKQFLKWQTPFEPLMSKYLDIKNEQGEEALYKGAMAKRMMPPPATAYVTLNARDSLVVNVDVLKGYTLNKAGKYTVTYTSEGVSGLKVHGEISFIYR